MGTSQRQTHTHMLSRRVTEVNSIIALQLNVLQKEMNHLRLSVKGMLRVEHTECLESNLIVSASQLDGNWEAAFLHAPSTPTSYLFIWKCTLFHAFSPTVRTAKMIKNADKKTETFENGLKTARFWKRLVFSVDRWNRYEMIGGRGRGITVPHLFISLFLTYSLFIYHFLRIFLIYYCVQLLFRFCLTTSGAVLVHEIGNKYWDRLQSLKWLQIV